MMAIRRCDEMWSIPVTTRPGLSFSNGYDMYYDCIDLILCILTSRLMEESLISIFMKESTFMKEP